MQRAAEATLCIVLISEDISTLEEIAEATSSNVPTSKSWANQQDISKYTFILPKEKNRSTGFYRKVGITQICYFLKN